MTCFLTLKLSVSKKAYLLPICLVTELARLASSGPGDLYILVNLRADLRTAFYSFITYDGLRSFGFVIEVFFISFYRSISLRLEACEVLLSEFTLEEKISARDRFLFRSFKSSYYGTS